MPPPYAAPHWGAFRAIPYAPAGAVGCAPSQWYGSLGFGAAVAGAARPLPSTKLNRAAVRSICRPLPPGAPNPPIFDWACAMAWGGQNRKHARNSFLHAHLFVPKILALRGGGLTRASAYNLFLPRSLGGAGNVPGLGPAFFTKLLYFLSPHHDFYIMDQWVAKSVNLLTNSEVVRINADGTVSNKNRCGNFAAFCLEIDEMGLILGQGGHQVEERLFSKGARPLPVGAWRAHVDAHWTAASAGFPPYNAASMHATYGRLTGLPLAAFL
jgi:hypothetical protein